jgi:hypothetical protein
MTPAAKEAEMKWFYNIAANICFLVFVELTTDYSFWKNLAVYLCLSFGAMFMASFIQEDQ